MVTSSRFPPSSLDAIPAAEPLRLSKGLSTQIATPPSLRGFVVFVFDKESVQ